MKKILYPTDFSETAENAFIFALQIADHLGASITTLHAFNKPDVSQINLPGMLNEVYESIDLDAFESYEDEIPILRDIATDNGYYHVPMVHVLEEGAPVSAILRTANKDKIDLIVMGATGASGVEAFFFGTVSGKVLEKAHCPVIVVPDSAEFDGLINHIGIATNFSEHDAVLIEAVRQFQKFIGGHLHVIHINTSNDTDTEERMTAFFAPWKNDKNMTCECIDHANVNDGLEEAMEKLNIDLLAILSHRRTWFDELFEVNRAKELSYSSSIPLLVFQQENLKV
jgi:nucleotide-binding universal stress UspA family protein